MLLQHNKILFRKRISGKRKPANNKQQIFFSIRSPEYNTLTLSTECPNWLSARSLRSESPACPAPGCKPDLGNPTWSGSSKTRPTSRWLLSASRPRQWIFSCPARRRCPAEGFCRWSKFAGLWATSVSTRATAKSRSSSPRAPTTVETRRAISLSKESFAWESRLWCSRPRRTIFDRFRYPPGRALCTTFEFSTPERFRNCARWSRGSSIERRWLWSRWGTCPLWPVVNWKACSICSFMFTNFVLLMKCERKK